MAYPRLVETVIERLSKLPGIGRRSAERMALWLLNHSKEDSRLLAESIINLVEGMQFCRICNNLSDTEICLPCSDINRDQHTICIVEDPKDVMAIERTGVYRGLYHVLLGTISPADGRGPEQLKIHQLLNRITTQDIREIIIATDPDNEGEMTALYLMRELKPTGVRVSRIGFGIPVGGAVEFADISTLSTSLTARRVITEVV